MVWKLTTLSGGFLGQFPAVFTKDGKAFFLCAGSNIRMYSVATGELLSVLKGHTDTVTCFLINELNPLQAYSAALDGTIKMWDYVEANCLRTFKVGLPVLHMCISSSSPHLAYLTLQNTKTATTAASISVSNHVASIEDEKDSKTSKKSNKKKHENTDDQNDIDGSTNDSTMNKVTNNPKSEFAVSKTGYRFKKPVACRVISFSLKGDVNNSKRTMLYKSRGHISAMAISGDGDYVMSVATRKLTVLAVKTGEVKKFTHARTLTQVVCHPSKDFIATGDSQGQITLWYGLMDQSTVSQSAKPVTSTLHWHAHAVNCLSFSADAAYLLSGGEEGVLVLWQIDTGHKQFLPRLGAPLNAISTNQDGSLFALSTSDNSCRLISSHTMREEKRVQGLTSAHTFNDKTTAPSTGLVLDPKHKLLVLNGLPGAIQFYDAWADRHVNDLEVIPRNYVSRIDSSFPVTFRIEQICFTSDAGWLVTLERRADGEFAENSAIKFWEYNSNAPEKYILNTRMDNPHKGKVTAMVAHPTKNMIVTASTDRTFRVWALVSRREESSIASKGGIIQTNASYWTCRSVGFYRDYQVRHAAFSADGSILAIAYGQIVTLWDPVSNTLLKTLSHPPPSEQIQKLSFLGASSALAVLTVDALYIWDLLTLSVRWTLKIAAKDIVVDSLTGRFALISNPTSHNAANAVVQNNTNDSMDIDGVETNPKKKNKSKSNKSKKKETDQAVEHVTDATSGSVVILFEAESSVPLHIWKVAESVIETVTFLPHPTTNSSSLVFLNQRHELSRLDQLSDEEVANSRSTDLNRPVVESDRSSAFEHMFGKMRSETSKPSRVEVELNPIDPTTSNSTNRALNRLFDGPSHVIPSLSKMLTSFMGLVLQKNQSSVDSTAVESTTEPASADPMEVDTVIHNKVVKQAPRTTSDESADRFDVEQTLKPFHEITKYLLATEETVSATPKKSKSVKLSQ
eukprot:GILJ01007228.1.p1 GENE.GILJ01007228.1~~GILJ01007228.1.p1  ORF type:complete len:966 (+),score=178.71 GILJ01007228.1:103-3000(+)